MAVETKIFCDHCSQIISSGDHTSLKPRTGPHRHDEATDLCGECFDQFRVWLGPGPLRSPEPTRPSRGRRPAAATPATPATVTA